MSRPSAKSASISASPRRSALAWGVFAPVDRLGPGDLAGNYAGAQGSASLGVGVGGNVLVGGSNNSIALQPLSVQGQVGLNVAAGSRAWNSARAVNSRLTVGCAALHASAPLRRADNASALRR